MNRDWSFYRASDGELSGRTWSGPDELLARNTPAGYVAIEGPLDHLAQRVDVTQTPPVVIAQAAPASHPELVHNRRQRAREAIWWAESQQARVVREFLLSLPNLPTVMRTRLEAIEATIVAAREDLL